MNGQDVRTLSDADVRAICEGLRETLKKEFYEDLGKGLWAFVWKAVVLSIIGIAATRGLK